MSLGGSNAIGAFGYIECIRELLETHDSASSSTTDLPYDHIIFACGSGGTVAGLAIGAKLSGIKSKLHAIGVCDSPEYFYDHIREVALNFQLLGPVESWVNIYHGQGIGYARSTEEELKYLIEFSEKTGILLDPVYSGKALYHFVNVVVKNNPSLFKKGDRVLYIHTGGTIGFYDKEKELLPLLATKNYIEKMKIKS